MHRLPPLASHRISYGFAQARPRRRASISSTSLEALLAGWQSVIQRALTQLAATPESSLAEPRFVGRARLPSTVLGLLFHAAEHAQRHTGQLVTTAKIVRSLRAGTGG